MYSEFLFPKEPLAQKISPELFQLVFQSRVSYKS